MLDYIVIYISAIYQDIIYKKRDVTIKNVNLDKKFNNKGVRKI